MEHMLFLPFNMKIYEKEYIIQKKKMKIRK